MEQYVRLNWKALVSEAKGRREELKLSQEKLAAIAEVSKPTLVNFEKGSVKISVENALKILRSLGLLDGEGV